MQFGVYFYYSVFLFSFHFPKVYKYTETTKFYFPKYFLSLLQAGGDTGTR
jgi:hypothetical protein